MTGYLIVSTKCKWLEMSQVVLAQNSKYQTLEKVRFTVRKTIKLSWMSDSFDWCIRGNLVGNVDSIRFLTRQSKERRGIHFAWTQDVDRWPVVYHNLTNHNISGFYEIVLISTHMSYFEENNPVYGNTDSVGQGHFLNQKTSILARNSICCPMDH